MIGLSVFMFWLIISNSTSFQLSRRAQRTDRSTASNLLKSNISSSVERFRKELWPRRISYRSFVFRIKPWNFGQVWKIRKYQKWWQYDCVCKRYFLIIIRLIRKKLSLLKNCVWTKNCRNMNKLINVEDDITNVYVRGIRYKESEAKFVVNNIYYFDIGWYERDYIFFHLEWSRNVNKCVNVSHCKRLQLLGYFIKSNKDTLQHLWFPIFWRNYKISFCVPYSPKLNTFQLNT